MALFAGKVGSVFANTLHTGGAIAFLAGLMLYVAWARGARRGDPHPALRNAGMAMTYVAVLANLIGGFIRTYAPGHPSFSDAFQEPWALLMIIKHAFLFAGMFAAVYLYEVVAPRLRNDPPPTSRKEAAAITAVALSILIATVLGAVAGVTTIGDMDALQAGNPNQQPQAPTDPDGVLFAEEQYAFDGYLTSLPPLQPGQSDGQFKIPANVARMEIALTWSDPVATLTLDLDGPDGTMDTTTGEGRVDATVQEPRSGTVRFSVSGENAINVQWFLTVRLVPAQSEQAFLSATVTIPPGATNVYEINTITQGGNLSWTWEVLEGQAIAYNIHTHFDDQVDYVVEENAAAHAGTYTVARAGGHSYMWENTGAVPLRVAYTVWGDFVVDSIYPESAGTMSSKLVG